MARRRDRGRRSYGYSGDDYGGYGGFAPYVSVGERLAQAKQATPRLEKKLGRKLEPAIVEGRGKMARTFWGQAWCDNLEAYSDFSNRLPRGRSYARNGSVIDLHIAKGKVTAYVSGSEIYEIEVTIKPLPAADWKAIQGDCARSIGSLIDLLQGRFDKSVMERLTRKDNGLFPKPRQIEMSCSCPDYAGLCKHLAAAMYGVGARLDQSPELLFTLRGVDHLELIAGAVDSQNLNAALAGDATDVLASDDLSSIFGIELDSLTSATTPATAPGKARKKQTVVRSTKARKTPTKDVAPSTNAKKGKKSARPKKKGRAKKPSQATVAGLEKELGPSMHDPDFAALVGRLKELEASHASPPRKKKSTAKRTEPATIEVAADFAEPVPAIRKKSAKKLSRTGDARRAK